MAAAAFLWRQVHPTSHQLLQAIVVAIELSSGYAETKRKAATGRIRTGESGIWSVLISMEIAQLFIGHDC